MGDAPDWSRLDEYQAQVTASDFRWLLDSHFAPDDAAKDWITIEPGQALIKRDAGDEAPAVLKFRAFEETPPPVGRYWRTRTEWAADKAELPLAGLKIALDPGHIGGDFAVMEFRSWKVGDGPLFREGDFVLAVAQSLKPRLEALGAVVTLVRDTPAPVTTDTPESLRPVAAELIAERELTPGLEIDVKDLQRRIDALARLLFYRVSEIKARAERVNESIQPDIVICLHVDGASLPEGVELADFGHAHFLINGAYSADEISYDDQRLAMLEKLLSGSWREERGLAAAMSESFAAVNPLPPYVYTGDNAIRINENPYLWARNLMANRLYACPTVFLEPYVANTKEFYGRFTKSPAGLVDEYADAVAVALTTFYGE
ncbi:hypothetical protein GCM10007047_12970 [Cerasicoccus arenae]|uniref:N-acetylmuramoyl-L-alanine amidase n=2 Tax=Cerasicoccus arenae TaxID=424488 RepID=A0A8J3DEX9_9BACT|nr:hypothetical protein GCM10007047_12970 [Cerasicoccus arenae]